MSIKNQHFITKAYLRGFSIPHEKSDKFIWVYTKEKNVTPKKKSVKVVASQDFYYAQEDEKGKMEPDKVEEQLGIVENLVLPIIHKIPSCDKRSFNLTGTEFGHLGYFIGLSFARVPSFRDSVRDSLQVITERTANMMLAAGMFDEPPPELKKYFEGGGEITTTIKEWASLKPMAQVSDLLAQSVIRKKWTFFIPYRGLTFVTSDNPVVFVQQRDMVMGPAHPMATIVYPLRRDLGLVCTFDPNGEARTLETKKHFQIKQFDKKNTKWFNQKVILAARKEIYSGFFSNPFARLVTSSEGSEQTFKVG
jgi:hypothetical protein